MAWWNRSDHYMSTLMDYVEAMYLGSGLAPADLDTSAEVAAIAGDFASIRKATVTLTDAQIKALPTTAVQLVAAPGANKVIIPVNTVLISNTLAGAYTAAAGASWMLMLGAVEASGVRVVGTGFITVASLRIGILPQDAQTALSGDFAGLHTGNGYVSGDVANQPLSIKDDWNGVADYTDGHANNTLTVVAYYTIVDVP